MYVFAALSFSLVLYKNLCGVEVQSFRTVAHLLNAISVSNQTSVFGSVS